MPSTSLSSLMPPSCRCPRRPWVPWHLQVPDTSDALEFPDIFKFQMSLNSLISSRRHRMFHPFRFHGVLPSLLRSETPCCCVVRTTHPTIVPDPSPVRSFPCTDCLCTSIQIRSNTLSSSSSKSSFQSITSSCKFTSRLVWTCPPLFLRDLIHHPPQSPSGFPKSFSTNSDLTSRLAWTHTSTLKPAQIYHDEI
jgi:hypothetical protein